VSPSPSMSAAKTDQAPKAALVITCSVHGPTAGEPSFSYQATSLS
jgi:hypothetical protein